jgi:hypothetical protein
MSLSLTHTPADGTLVTGTARGDGTAAVLKAQGWRWSRALGAWYLRGSRDRAPQMPVIAATADALSTLRHEVFVSIDASVRAASDVEADRQQRAAERADRLAVAAERAAGRAEQAAARDAAALRRLPPDGQPILVGHHSEGRHRRDLDRAHAAAGALVSANAAAEEAARRARVAAVATSARHAPVTVANRVERLAAEQRRAQREIDAHGEDDAGRRAAHLAQVTDELDHWTAVRAEQIATGVATDFGRHNVAAGDRVRVRGRWYEVVRANAKTVTVPSSLGPWTDTTPWHEVTEHRPAPTA